ncbi:MAG TPA: thermonuclease family protein [Ignavibacteria bacterium]|nr:thermonuclease family protein [Ignavibacteria bacterium]
MIRYLKIFFIVSLFIFTSCSEETANIPSKNQKQKNEPVHSETSSVKRVVDGDTFELENGERVRLLGIDTPEKFTSNKMDSDAKKSGLDVETIKQLGEAASHYADSLMEGRKIFLVSDPLNDDKDRYGRLLRYIYTEDGMLYNLKIILDGYAFAYTNFPVIMKDTFLNAEESARKNKRGLWSNESFNKLKEN